MILKICCSVNQIDHLQSSNKKQSWTIFHLPWFVVILKNLSYVITFLRTLLCQKHSGLIIYINVDAMVRRYLVDSNLMTQNKLVIHCCYILLYICTALLSTEHVYTKYYITLEVRPSCVTCFSLYNTAIAWLYPHIIVVNDLTIVSASNCFCLLLNIYHQHLLN